MAGILTVRAEVTFSDIVRNDTTQRSRSIDIKADGSDSIWDVKSKIAVRSTQHWPAWMAASLDGNHMHVRRLDMLPSSSGMPVKIKHTWMDQPAKAHNLMHGSSNGHSLSGCRRQQQILYEGLAVMC